ETARRVRAAVPAPRVHNVDTSLQRLRRVRPELEQGEARPPGALHRLVPNALHPTLPRHADHHMCASKPFWELDALADSPKLPHGYQTMSMIALFPAGWRRATDPLLADWDRRLANDVERTLVRERGWTIDVSAPRRAHGGSA